MFREKKERREIADFLALRLLFVAGLLPGLKEEQGDRPMIVSLLEDDERK